MIVLPFFYIGTVGSLFIWSLMTWAMAALVLLIEFPLPGRLLSESSPLYRVTRWTYNLFFRALSYLLYVRLIGGAGTLANRVGRFAICLWLSWIVSWSWLIIPAVLLTATAACYGLAIWRREELTSSSVFSSSPPTDPIV